MIHVKKTDNGMFGFGTIENENDVEELIEKLIDLIGGDDDDEECEAYDECDECECECEASEDCDCNDAPHDDLLDALMDAIGWDEDEEDECEDEVDGLPHVVSIGYTHDYDQVVIMNDRDTKWGLAEAFLRAAAKVWPIEVESDEKLRMALLELAGVAHEHVDSDD